MAHNDGAAKPKADGGKTKVPRFVKWIDAVGALVIAEHLGVTKWAVYGWRNGALGLKGGTRPDPSRLGDIIRFSAGELTAADIYPSQKQ